MRALFNVDVLVALLDPQHTEHARAHRWLAANNLMGWASCPMTESGYLRVVTHRRYPNPVSPSAALAQLAASKQGGHHAFWLDDLSVTDGWMFDWGRLQAHERIADVYLLALAVEHGGRLVTFDRHIPREAVKGSRPEHLVTL